jgi:hypothetical protein
MTRYVVALAIEVDADRISDVDDVAMAMALERFPGVVSVHGGGVVERDESDDDRTVWADVLDSIQP